MGRSQEVKGEGGEKWLMTEPECHKGKDCRDWYVYLSRFGGKGEGWVVDGVSGGEWRRDEG